MDGDGGRIRALLLFGGWEGHSPREVAEFAESEILFDCAIERSETLDCLDESVLSQFDVLLPIWTFGEISTEQERALLKSVEHGLGILAWHGATSAFLASRPHKHLLGGQFVAHPGGDTTTFRVDFAGHSELTRDLEGVELTSEQYYLLVDPAVDVLATTVMIAQDEMTWLRGVRAPVAWTRTWGNGRVFYSSIGHVVDDLRHPSVLTLLRRALHWSARPSLACTPESSSRIQFAQS